MPLAEAHVAGTIGQRARHRLSAHPDFEQVIALAEASRRAASPDASRQAAAPATMSLDDAIAILRALDADDADGETTDLGDDASPDSFGW